MLPQIPQNAPFSDAQRAWLNGYFAGLFSRQDSAERVVPATPAGAPVTVVFGSQTGTAESLARKAAKKLTASGHACTVAALNDVEPHALVDAENLLVVTSTHGEGEMPDNASVFWEMLASGDAPRLERLRFSVLALGDASYTDFCAAGRNLDARLEALGAVRLHPRVDADVDFEEPFEEWFRGVSEALEGSAEMSLLKRAA